MRILLILTCSALNIFLVPHSHISTGLTLTIDESYKASALKILKNMLLLLEERPSLKFIWSEAAYMQRFLSESPEHIPALKQYILEGRLEIVGGGWLVHDEALVDFESLTRLMLAGHKFYKEALGVNRIKVAWQINSFGHSSLTAAILEKMGFEYLVLSRIDEDFRVNLN